MNRPSFARPPRSLLAGLLVVALGSLAVGWTAGTVAASGGTHPTPSAATPASKGNSNSAELVAPGDPQAAINTGYAGSGVASGAGGGTSVAYPGPGYPGSLGAAPEGTILAGGTGTADMRPDGSDRASALAKATTAALADARTQAQAVATSMGVALKGVYSVSVSAADSYTYPVPDCLIPPVAPGAVEGGSAGSGTGTVPNEPAASSSAAVAPAMTPEVCTQTKTTAPSSAQLVVFVIVAYNFA